MSGTNTAGCRWCKTCQYRQMPMSLSNPFTNDPNTLPQLQSTECKVAMCRDTLHIYQMHQYHVL